MKSLFFFFFISIGLLNAADYSCNGEWVTNITGATNDQSKSYYEDSTGGGGYSRYFRFQTNVDGTISININKFSIRQEIYIGTSCGGTQLHDGGSNTTNYSATFSITAGTTYYIRMRERNGSNNIKFNISFDFIAASVSTCTGTTGLCGTYYNNETWSAPNVLQRDDANIDFPWGNGSPDPSVNNDHFSVAWTGFIVIPEDATYTFHAIHDDSFNVTIDGGTVYDRATWTGSLITDSAHAAFISAGCHPFTAKVSEGGGGASAHLEWSNSASIGSHTTIPAANFSQTCNAADLALSEYLSPAPNPANVDEEVTFSIRAQNTGNLDADPDIILTTTYSQDVNISSVTAPGDFTCNPVSGLLLKDDNITCTRTTSMTSGDSQDFSFVVKPQSGGTFTQTASISTPSSEVLLSNNEINSSVTVPLPSFCEVHKSDSTVLVDGDPGFTRVNPFNDLNSSFEIFCTNTSPAETLISLPMKNTFNNFVFDTHTVASDYYDQATNNSTGFNAIKVSIDSTHNRLIVDTSGSATAIGVMGQYFSSINLIGTPFAIDWSNTVISGCNEAKLRKGYHGQAVKINTLDYSDAICKIEQMELKLLDDYTYLEYAYNEVLEPTCKEMAESVPISFLDSASVKGHYWINPKGGSRGGTTFTTTGRPFVAYCWYQTDLDWVWTFLLALDGKRTINKSDLVNGQDSCSQLGLWPFVANKESTFERVRSFLDNQKTEWVNYTGTIQEKVSALSGVNYYLATEQPEPIWPYGSFGVYYPYNGNLDKTNSYKAWGDGNYHAEGWMAGSPMHNEKTITSDYGPFYDGPNRNYYSHGNYSDTAPTSSGTYAYTDTMGSKGWVSILGPNDLNKTEEWFISRTSGGDNFDSTGDYPYYEPNGNYDAGCWLNFLFDSNGRVRHNDDWSCNYPYYDYMCMAEDNYDFATRYGLVDGPFKAIERTVTTTNGMLLTNINTNISTKIVNGPLQLDIILLDDALTHVDKDQNITAGMYFMDTVLDPLNNEVPRELWYLGQISDYNTSNGRFSLNASAWPNGTETWSSADKRVFVEFKYCKDDRDNWTECWDNTTFPPTCKDSLPVSDPYSNCKVADSNDFAVRPGAFQFSTTSNLSVNTLKVRAMRDLNISLQALDNIGVPSVDYNETQDGSFRLDINISDPAKICPIGAFSIAPSITFADGEDNRTNYTFSGVGDYNVTIEEIQGSEFALVDANDTSDANRYITPFSDTIRIVPDHFRIVASVADASGPNSFTYLSNDSDAMGAELNLTVVAEDFVNATTPNYNTDCYAKSADINITQTITPGIANNQNINLNNNINNNIIIYDNNTTALLPGSPFDKNDTTIQLSDPLPFSAVPSTRFTTGNNGTATLSYKINLERNVTIPVNPFIFTINNISYADSDNVTQNLLIDTNLTYVYGRLHTPRYRVDGSDSNVTHYYEVFCATCNPSSGDFNGVIGLGSVDSVNWFRNPMHTNTRAPILGTLQATSSARAGNVAVANNNFQIERVTYNTARGYPFKSVIDVNASPWLIYNRYIENANLNSFDLEFNQRGAAQAGPATTGGNAEVNSNRRIMW